MTKKAGWAKTLGSKENPIASLRYVYDADGTLSAREVNGRLQKYEYDLKGQLIAVKECNTGVPLATAGEPLLAVNSDDWKLVEKYVYDPAGNILRKIVNGKETIFSYDKANQLVSSEEIPNPNDEIRSPRFDHRVEAGNKSEIQNPKLNMFTTALVA